MEKNLVQSVGGKDIKDMILEEFDSDQLIIEQLDIINEIIWTRYLPRNYCEYLKYCAQNHNAVDMETFYTNHYEKSDEMVHIPIPHLLLIRIPGDNIVELIQAGTLKDYISKVCKYFKGYYDSNMKNVYVPLFEDSSTKPIFILLIEGLQSFIKARQQARYREIMNSRKSKKRTNDQTITDSSNFISEQSIEKILIEIQLNSQCNIFQTKNAKESADFIVGITKNLAEAPYKKQTTIIDFRAGGSAGSIRYISEKVNEDEEGELQIAKKKDLSNSEIWCNQLMEIPSVTAKIANTIAKVYPSPRSLLDAYKRIDRSCNNEHERIELKKNLLKDIQCEWGIGEGARMDQRSMRKLGPAISAKIYAVFNCD